MSESKPARFITLEGIEGVGKSTNLEFASAFLKQNGIPHVVTREPGGTPMAEEIRELLLRPREEKVHDLTELLLIFAARAQHLHSFIVPHLRQGTWVLCDRFTDATFAYQGGGRELDMDTISQLENIVQGTLRPDRIIWLDAPVNLGMKRIAERKGAPDRFENERHRFFERVRNVYEARATAQPDHYRRIDASAPLEQVKEALEVELASLINS